MTPSWRLRAYHGRKPIEIKNVGTIDEVVIAKWLHIEQLDKDRFHARIGDARIEIYCKDPEKVIVNIERGAFGPILGDTRMREKKD